MKKRFTRILAAFALLVFMMPSLVGWGQTRETKTDVLNRDLTEVTGTSYTDWSGKTSNSNAVWAGNSAGGNSSIQLRSSNSNSGIITTTSGGTLKSVTVEWNNSTSNGRTLRVYGKNSPYASASDLYDDSKQGTLLGTIVYGTSTSLTISGTYEFIGMRSASGAMYLTTINVEWETGGSTPTVAAPTFSPANGTTFEETLQVTLSQADNKDIYYNINSESDPNANSTHYTGPFSINTTSTIKAIAIDGENTSSVATATYTKLVYNSIEDIVANQTQYTVKGTVVATNNRGFVIGDGTGYVYTYLNELPSQAIGDKVRISGSTGSYGHVLQFTSSATITTSTTSNYDGTPAIVTVDANAMAGFNSDYQLSDYVQYEGTLTKSTSSNNNTYYNIAVGSATARISYQTTAQANQLEALLNKTVKVKGYFAGFSSNIFTTMMESVEEVETPTINVSPATAEEFTYVAGNGPSEEQIFEVTGLNLTSTDITVSVEQNGAFEITDNEEYGYTLTIASGDMFSVRMKAGLEAGSYSGTVTLSSQDATDVTIDLTGTVTEPETPHYTWNLKTNSYSSATENLVTWTSDYATMTNAKENSSTPANNYLGGTNNRTSTRFYNGQVLTITPVSGYAITRVVFEATTNGYATTFKNSEWANATASMEEGGTIVTVTPANGDAAIVATIEGTCGFNAVSVYYEESLFVYYDIELDDQIENGTIAADKTRAQEGELITLTAIPDENYYLDEWTVLDGNAEVVPVTISTDNPNVATFNMPAKEVIVSATFATTLVYYTITIDDEIEHGTVTADMQQAVEAATVTLTITPETGYILEDDNLLVMAGSDEVDVTKVNATTYTFEMPAANVEVTAEFTEYVGGALYTLATSIESGKHYIIASSKEDGTIYVMGGQNSNNRAAVTQTIEDEMIITTSPNVAEFVINGPDANGYYTIYDAKVPGYLYAASSGSNHLKTEAHLDSDNNGLWTITFGDNDNAIITAQGRNTRNLMRFNPGSSTTAPLFSCYASGQQPVYIYEKDGETDYTFYKDITGYGTSTGGYYLIASPVSTNPGAAGMITDDLGAQATSETATYDLYSFDQAENLEWINYRQGGFNTINPGKGYLYASKEGVTLTFAGVPSTTNTATLSLSGNGDFAGWNLVGNPFSVPAYIGTRAYYRIGNGGADIVAATAGTAIDVMEGVFVIAAQDEEQLTFSTTAAKGASVAMNVVRERGNVIDRAIVRFDEGDQLPKFQLNPNNTKIYVTEGNKDYAVVRSAADAEMPVSFRASENGTYTLAVEAENVEMNYLHLIDNMTGADVDLLATPSYTFEANTTDYASRFRLVFSTNSISEDADGDSAFAYYNGSSWTVSNMGEATLQVVDVMGRVLSSETLSGNAEVSINQTPGVYMLRLVSGDSVKVQKVVVR